MDQEAVRLLVNSLLYEDSKRDKHNVPNLKRTCLHQHSSLVSRKKYRTCSLDATEMQNREREMPRRRKQLKWFENYCVVALLCYAVQTKQKSSGSLRIFRTLHAILIALFTFSNLHGKVIQRGWKAISDRKYKNSRNCLVYMLAYTYVGKKI